jgi:hypothetical protein
MGWGTTVSIAACYGLHSLGTDPGGGDILHTRPYQPWGLPSLLYNGYWVFFWWGRLLNGQGVAFTIYPPTHVEVKERVELYLCSPSEPS